MLSVLEENRTSDLLSQRTGLGIHKDDIEFLLNNQPLKKFGSQGQIKSFVIALKIAQYQYFKQNSQQYPILLLDDIFEKIDSQRSQKLMERMCSTEFGQIFISDTHSEIIIEHFYPFDVAQKHFTLV
jgi:DNA replication and repair protein RecF